MGTTKEENDKYELTIAYKEAIMSQKENIRMALFDIKELKESVRLQKKHLANLEEKQSILLNQP